MTAMCGVRLKNIKRAEVLMLMLGFDEAIDQLAMANSVHWYDYVLRREDGHVLIRALHFEIETQGRNATFVH